MPCAALDHNGAEPGAQRGTHPSIEPCLQEGFSNHVESTPLEGLESAGLVSASVLVRGKGQSI